ncbi:Hypothetical protein A7982_07259 [Minicystis rosea]|nr:Hypothetical protein A7982_07259 [Minicystis rosea]
MLERLRQFLSDECTYLRAHYGADSETYEVERRRFLAYFERDLIPTRRPGKPDAAWFASQRTHLDRVAERTLFFHGTFVHDSRTVHAFCLSQPQRELRGLYWELLHAFESEGPLKLVSSYLWDYPSNRDHTHDEASQWEWTRGIQFPSFPALSAVTKLVAPENPTQRHYYDRR